MSDITPTVRSQTDPRSNNLLRDHECKPEGVDSESTPPFAHFAVQSSRSILGAMWLLDR